jgi:hypothetical protein
MPWRSALPSQPRAAARRAGAAAHLRARYRELIGECLEQGGEFGLVLADDDGMREIGCRAGVIEVFEQFEDGR